MQLQLELLLLAAAAQSHPVLGKAGGGYSGGGRRAYGGGGHLGVAGVAPMYLSTGFTRNYYYVYGGTRYNCWSCQRTTDRDTMNVRMTSIVVTAEFDVTFANGTAPGSDDVPGSVQLLLEPYIEGRVAKILSDSVPSVTMDDVNVRDSWPAPASCTGSASCDLEAVPDITGECPAGCSLENNTYMYEVSIFTGEVGAGDVSTTTGEISPNSTASRVFNALRLCSSCGSLAAPGAWQAASCSSHREAFGQELGLLGAFARITDCGNRSLEVMTLESDVEFFDANPTTEDSGSTLWIVIFLLMVFLVLCCRWVHSSDSEEDEDEDEERELEYAATEKTIAKNVRSGRGKEQDEDDLDKAADAAAAGGGAAAAVAVPVVVAKVVPQEKVHKVNPLALSQRDVAMEATRPFAVGDKLVVVERQDVRKGHHKGANHSGWNLEPGINVFVQKVHQDKKTKVVKLQVCLEDEEHKSGWVRCEDHHQPFFQLGASVGPAVVDNK